MIWVGLAGEKDRLLALQGFLEQNLQKLWFPLEGCTYSPHLILGRPREFGTLDPLVREIEKQKHTQLGVCKSSSVQLMQSTLTPIGHVYTVLERVPLGH
ncbi:MAG: hypothetical protein M1119_06625 [Firmicutes bacterium]|nr:hypothetical protein [Bacillota bacterium]